jgi:predicted transposase YbfD/YdcC
MARAMLLKGKLVTADALHTVSATAEFICDHGGEFVLPVKENRWASRSMDRPFTMLGLI